ncbi:MAG: gliding motility lipoprotein GldH [Bacteroidota bacterium]|nr:gliding motility lipoprotein GldH [Odoribacter sp.]MDP3641579.1 gliding motility lipoprotein GldH [Bacteroidota bacterium]
MKQFFYLFLCILLMAGIFSCDRKRVFESYYELDKKGWHKDSVVVFNLTLTDTIKNNNLYVNIRNKGTYAYSNLWLFLTIGSPDGALRTDTVEFTLAEPSGKWKGSGVGGLHDNHILYKKSVYFPHKGNYTFSIKQGMRDNVLEGIRDVGIRIEKTY